MKKGAKKAAKPRYRLKTGEAYKTAKEVHVLSTRKLTAYVRAVRTERDHLRKELDKITSQAQALAALIRAVKQFDEKVIKVTQLLFYPSLVHTFGDMRRELPVCKKQLRDIYKARKPLLLENAFVVAHTNFVNSVLRERREGKVVAENPKKVVDFMASVLDGLNGPKE